jgi:phosphopantothenoylcysteine decarboxylase / phosphopantothenate---cysteine ligase
MNILITAGPTREPIDPVRYISNHSTGRMGIALAEQWAASGHNVTLILGPTQLAVTGASITVIHIETAAEMYQATAQYFAQSDVIIFAAAVADYTPLYPANQKIKKKEAELILALTKTIDIAGTLAATKTSKQYCVGFALETEQEEAHALDKLQRKNLDLIVLNSLRDAGAGFGHDTNKVTLLDKKGNVLTFGLKSKTEVAQDIVKYILLSL